MCSLPAAPIASARIWSTLTRMMWGRSGGVGEGFVEGTAGVILSLLRIRDLPGHVLGQARGGQRRRCAEPGQDQEPGLQGAQALLLVQLHGRPHLLLGGGGAAE